MGGMEPNREMVSAKWMASAEGMSDEGCWSGGL